MRLESGLFLILSLVLATFSIARPCRPNDFAKKGGANFEATLEFIRDFTSVEFITTRQNSDLLEAAISEERFLQNPDFYSPRSIEHLVWRRFTRRIVIESDVNSPHADQSAIYIPYSIFNAAPKDHLTPIKFRVALMIATLSALPNALRAQLKYLAKSSETLPTLINPVMTDIEYSVVTGSESIAAPQDALGNMFFNISDDPELRFFLDSASEDGKELEVRVLLRSVLKRKIEIALSNIENLLIRMPRPESVARSKNNLAHIEETEESLEHFISELNKTLTIQRQDLLDY